MTNSVCVFSFILVDSIKVVGKNKKWSIGVLLSFIIEDVVLPALYFRNEKASWRGNVFYNKR